MALLGIGKKSEPENPDQGTKEEVPEELPDLPQDAVNAPEAAADAAAVGAEGGVPDELPPADQELAPDELPPVADASDSELAPPGDDKRLYFSSMLQKLHDEGIKSTKLTLPTANLLSDMKKHWKQNKRSEEMVAVMQRVTESITPLQKLEQEWVTLNDDIEQKKQLLHEKEEDIRKLAEQAKSLASKAEKMKSKAK